MRWALGLRTAPHGVTVEKLFTREEAEELLPRVVPTLEGLRALFRQLEARQREQAAQQQHARGNGKVSLQEEVGREQADSDRLRIRIQREMQRLLELGVEVKDLEMGLIDFRSMRDGRVVYLCWKLGEEGIGFWHELDAGFAGRQPL